MGEIRDFMDTATMGFQRRKAEEEKKQEYSEESLCTIFRSKKKLSFLQI